MYKIKKILPIADFKLVLEYSDGVSIVADFIPIIQQGKVFQPLRDPNFFAKVSLDNTGRYIYWEGEIEFCADALRMKGKVIEGKVIDEDFCLNQAMDEGKNTPLYLRAESLAFLED